METKRFKRQVIATIDEHEGAFEGKFKTALYKFARVSEFIWDIQKKWFDLYWRPGNPREEVLFLLLNNARVDLVSAVDSLRDGFIRGPNLLAKSALEKISAMIKLRSNDQLMKKFLKGEVTEKKWVLEVGQSYPMIRQLYTFIESNFTHDPYSSFAGPYAVRECEIDEHFVPPSVDHYLGIRMGTILNVQSAHIILAQFTDLHLNGGINLWTKENSGYKTVDNVFDQDYESLREMSSEIGKYLEEKYPGEIKVRYV